MREAGHFKRAEFPEPIQVLLSPDRLTADLLLMPLNGHDPPTVDLCCEHLQQRGVVVDHVVRRIVMKVLEALPRASRHLRVTVARGFPASNGQDGRIEWFIETPSEGGAVASSAGHEPLIVVRRGQYLGRVIEPTDGRDGREVTGAVLKARRGRAVDLEIDDTITRDEHDCLIAGADGVLHREERTLLIRPESVIQPLRA